MSKCQDETADVLVNQVSEVEIEHSTMPVVHEWVQRGSDLECYSCPNPHGTLNAIPHGKMLIKNDKGEYDIVAI